MGHSPKTSESKTDSSTKVLPNNLYNNSFLMPPNCSTFQRQPRNNRNCSSSIAISSDKLSETTSSNLTATTSLNQTNSSTNMNHTSQVIGSDKQPFINNESFSGTDCDTSWNSNNLHNTHLEDEPDFYNGKYSLFLLECRLKG